MDLYDQHLHSRYSFDSETDPADHVETALARGLAGLTFTEHFDTHPEDWRACRYDDEAYSDAIERLRACYGSSIFIGKGIEVCFQPDRMDFVLDFLRGHRFDLVTLSVHYFQEDPVHERDRWAGLDVQKGTRRYLETVLEAVRFCERLHRKEGRVFDVLGHLDLVKRYTHRFFGAHDIASFPDLVDDILRTCLDAGMTPEVNTSTLRQGLDEPIPGPDTMARYVALGGTAMSLGSDAHRAEDVASDFDKALIMLHTAGIRSVAVFKRREGMAVPLTGG